MDNLVLYEHPLHETVRICLRLECLFAQADYRLSHEGYWNNRAAIATLIDIVNVLDRPDFKAKLTKRLLLSKDNLSQHLSDDKVDQSRLGDILQQLTDSVQYLQNSSGKLNSELEQNEFLNSVRMRLSKTGGARNFDLPMYHYWLHLSEDKCKQDIQHWLSTFHDFKNILDLYLMLMRQSTQFFNVTAVNGYYEKMFDTSIDYQLLRVYVDKTICAFPDMSVGRHRVNLHFFTLNEAEKPAQFKEDVDFKLALCV
jgi:cell division protein ZapD